MAERGTARAVGALAGRRVSRLGAQALLLALIAGISAWGIARDEARRRTGVEDRFDTRVAASARFLDAYVDQVLQQAHGLALASFSGRVTQEGFGTVASSAGFETAGLFDRDDRLIANLPSRPLLLGDTDIGDRLPALRPALAGRTVVSDVTTSLATGERIVLFAVPFLAGPEGWRVFAGTYAVADTPFEDYLSDVVPFRPFEAYLVDSAGAVVATPIPRLTTTLAGHRPELARALGARRDGFLDAGGDYSERTYYTSSAVPRTPWRLVFTTPERALYAPLGGIRWLPWAILAGFVLAGVAGIGIAERYLAQRARLRTVLATAEDAFVGMDAGGRITDWNRAAGDIFGWTAREVIGRPLAEVLVPERLREAHTAGLARFLAAGERTLPARVELTGLHRDGREVPVEMSLATVWWEGAWHFHAFLRDVSDRHAAQAALVEAERRFRVAFDLAPVGMALTSLEAGDLGRLVRVNRALSTILGYTVGELEERTLVDVAHPEDRASLRDLTRRLHEGRSVEDVTFEKRCLHADGHLLWVEMHATAIDDGVGAHHYAVAQVDDITDRRAESERLTALALQDPLTGLANRALLSDRLHQALTRTARTGRPVVLLMCDLDGFKPVNDTYGHAAGDEILREVATRLREVVRSGDTVARIGGDEFVILCEDLDDDTADDAGRRIEERLGRPYTLGDGTTVRLGASVGAATGAGPGLEARALLALADGRMYEAKRHHHAGNPAG
jgi:diguanylate cyclase (GGDEF)-like protein/PAS domain S-box-containing protein